MEFVNLNLSEAWEFIRYYVWIILPIISLSFILFLSALISVLRKDVSGSEKLPWILVILFIQTFGPIIYFVIGSSKLDEKISQREESE